MEPNSRKRLLKNNPRNFWTAFYLPTLLLAALGLAPPAAAEPTPAEPEEQSDALLAVCELNTVGLPCDPDGIGPASECGGVCWLDTAGQAGCQPIAELQLIAQDLNGRICGDAQGLDCSRSCENGQCVDRFARLGAACRPDATSSSCDGLCTLTEGMPSCERVDSCATFGADECRLTACDFDENSKGCVEYVFGDEAVCGASPGQQPTPGAAGAPGTGPGAGPAPGASGAADSPATPAKIAGGACSLASPAAAGDRRSLWGVLLFGLLLRLRRRGTAS